MADDITIRPIASQAELAACVELQRDTWGRDFNDVVPASILLVAQKIGGVTAGAFTADGRLVGFVFGITGVENGEIVHWSDMLAVRPDARNKGVGRRLKEFQRSEVAKVGAKVIYWTFDPLVARNAHLNFNVFGVRAVKYVRDMYGDHTGSDLHRIIGTDRLIVAWSVAVTRREVQGGSDVRGGAPLSAQTVVVGGPESTGTTLHDAVSTDTPIAIPVPTEIAAMQRTDPTTAAAWRRSTRAAFEAALGAGYTISGFHIDEERKRGLYVLAPSANTATA